MATFLIIRLNAPAVEVGLSSTFLQNIQVHVLVGNFKGAAVLNDTREVPPLESCSCQLLIPKLLQLP